jgi:hypothetical protein
MKKLLFAMMIGMTAGLVMAQDAVMVEKQQADLAVTGNVDLYSAYVWRGQIINDGPVAQPSLTVAKGPVSLNVWANYNIDGKDGNEDTDVSETDFTFSYTIPDSSDNFDINVGAIHYALSNSGATNASDDTTELFVSSTFNNIILTPVASLYYDADEAEGWYGSLALAQGFEISDALTAEVGGSVGIGESSYNDYYFGKSGASMNDYNVYVSASYAVTEDLSLGAKLAYTMLDGAVADEAKDKTKGGFGADNTLWGGVTLSYQF